MITAAIPVSLSPCCGEPLDGGPAVFWCTGCGHDVHGSAIERDYLRGGPVNAVLAAMRADIERAGFTREERVAFLEAIDKAAHELTAADLGLLDRYEAAVNGETAGAA